MDQPIETQHNAAASGDQAAGTAQSKSGAPWHVLWTRSHSEHLVHDQLTARGLEVLFPTIEMWKRVRGMRYRVTVPMFSGYLFLHHQIDPQSYVDILRARGLVKILGESWSALAVVPESEIDAVRKLHASRLSATPHPYIRIGQRVRVIGGLLAGAEGILLRRKENKGLLVISIDLLQQSVAVEIDCTQVAPD